jgi:peptidoglycan lytic transglycosylase B
MRIARALALLLLLALAAPSRAEDDGPESFAQRADVAAFIHELVERHAFKAEELHSVFSRTRREDAVLSAMRAQPRQSDSWEAYRALFVNERHLRNGLAFWQENRGALQRARRAYGVPEEIVVAIIGVETFYGRNTGRWRVIDALTTLAFDYPPRALFFRGELENYLLFARELQLDVFSVKGSYAGAIGMPQFMPGSYLRYAVDFDGDGTINLLDNAADAIGSVANFLRRHGWRPGEPVQRPARISGEGYRGVVAADAQPRNTLDELRRLGVEARGAPLPGDMPAALLRLESPQKQDVYRIGMQNLYVLTRYNRNLFYAMSVADLAAQLRAARARSGAATAK